MTSLRRRAVFIAAKALRQDDTSFVPRTKLESTRYRPQNIVVLRAVLINPLTDGTVLKKSVGTQNRIGLTLWSEFNGAYQRVVNLPHQA